MRCSSRKGWFNAGLSGCRTYNTFAPSDTEGTSSQDAKSAFRGDS
jgi:hypothetical protein